jgi:hypothetical protein
MKTDRWECAWLAVAGVSAAYLFGRIVWSLALGS